MLEIKKAKIELDTADNLIMNHSHTLGHAIESINEYTLTSPLWVQSLPKNISPAQRFASDFLAADVTGYNIVVDEGWTYW